MPTKMESHFSTHSCLLYTKKTLIIKVSVMVMLFALISLSSSDIS